MIHTNVIKNIIKAKDTEKLETYLKEEQFLCVREIIDLLRDESIKNIESLRKTLMGNPKFLETASLGEVIELDFLINGKESPFLSLESEIEPSRPYLYREDVKRVETEDGRKYVLDENTEFSWPGVTSIWEAVKPFDKRIWIKSLQRKHPDWDMDQIVQFMEDTKNNAAARGSATHNAIEKYFENPVEFNFEEDCEEAGKPYFKNLLPLLRYEVDQIVAVEPLVWWDMSEVVGHEKAGAIGYIDMIGIHRGKTVLYDWKTADKPKRKEYLDNYFTQVSAYAAMVYQTYGIKIDEVRICIAIPGAKAPQVFTLPRYNMKRYLQLFISNVKEYCKMLDDFED